MEEDEDEAEELVPSFSSSSPISPSSSSPGNRVANPSIPAASALREVAELLLLRRSRWGEAERELGVEVVGEEAVRQSGICMAAMSGDVEVGLCEGAGGGVEVARVATILAH